MRLHWKWPLTGGLVLIVALAAVIALPGRGETAAGDHGAGRGAAPAAGPATRPAAGGPAPAATRAGLSPRQLAGQRVIYSYPGLAPPASLLSLIAHGQAAGVIFFGPNIASPAQIAAVIRQLDQADASPSNPVRAPLLLMTDQEGGPVRRLPGQPYLPQKQIGENPLSQAEQLATAAGQGAAANLRAAGMDVNLAPVLDVYRQAGDFDDQSGRSCIKARHGFTAPP